MTWDPEKLLYPADNKLQHQSLKAVTSHTSMRQQGTASRRLYTGKHWCARDSFIWGESVVPKVGSANSHQGQRPGKSRSFSKFRDFKFEDPISSLDLA